MNHKKVERLYWEHGLSLRSRARNKPTAASRVALQTPTQPGLCYAMDFVHDRLITGQRFKCFTMTNPCSKEVSVIAVGLSIGGERMRQILDLLIAGWPLPEALILDNGPEFAGNALDAWACQRGSTLHFIQQGSQSRTRLLRASMASFGMSV